MEKHTNETNKQNLIRKAFFFFILNLATRLALVNLKLLLFSLMNGFSSDHACRIVHSFNENL